MANNSEFPLSLIIKAVDQATAPLRQINERIKSITEPARKLNNSFKALAMEAGLPKLVAGFKEVGTAVGKVASELSGLALKVTAMSAAAAFGLYRIIKGAVDSGDKLSEMAGRVGLTVQAYARLRFAAEQSDVSTENFDASMDHFNRTLGDAKHGTGALTSMLNDVSPALLAQLKGAKDNAEAFKLMMVALDRVKDPAKRAALTAAAFGRGGAAMAGMVQKGADAIDEYGKRFDELGGNLEKFADGSSEADNAIRETKTAFEGSWNGVMAEFMPVLSEIAGHLTKFFVENREGIIKWAKETAKAILDWVRGGGIERLQKKLEAFGDKVKEIVEAIGGLKSVFVLIGAVMAGGVLKSIVGLGKALFSLGGSVIPLVMRAVMLIGPAISGIGSVFGPVLAMFGPLIAAVGLLGVAGYLLYSRWDKIKLFFKFLWEDIVEIFQSAWKKITELATKISDLTGKFALEFLDPSGERRKAQMDAFQEKKRLLHGTVAPGTGPLLTPQTTEARVAVDFNNLPRGARVTPDADNTAPLDLSLGYTMVGH